jgi:hypothetical protein
VSGRARRFDGLISILATAEHGRDFQCLRGPGLFFWPHTNGHILGFSAAGAHPRSGYRQGSYDGGAGCGIEGATGAGGP